jgi:aminoacrylate hydrolase
MPYLEVPGARLAYQITGQGVPVLFISGLNGRASFWRRQLDALPPSISAISFDHRGIGVSTGAPPYSVELWADDAIRLLDFLEISAVHVVGHSTGGAIAQVMASDHPERVLSLVLGATWASPDRRFHDVFRLRRDVLRALGPSAYEIFGALLTAPVEAPWPPRNATGSLQPSSAVLEARLEALLAYEGIERLPHIVCPALVLSAADDVLIPPRLPRALVDGIVGARSVSLPAGGHLFPTSRPDEYNRLVFEFLRDVTQRTATGGQSEEGQSYGA